MKRFVLGAAALLLPILAASPSWALDKVVYQLGFLRSGAQANVYTGIKSGAFEKAGLEVEVLEGKGALDTMTKVATGTADIGEVSFDVYLAAKAEQDIPVIAVMPEYTQVPDSLITAKGNGIKSLKDVGGRKIGTPQFTSSNLMWPVLLKTKGVDPDSVTLLKVQPSTLAGMLATGQIDGAILWATTEPTLKPILAKAGKDVNVIRWTDEGYEGYGQSLTASRKFMTERPDVLRRFLKVMKESVVLAYKDTDQAAKYVHEWVPQIDIETVKGQIDAGKQFIFNPVTERDGLGMYAPARVKTSWEWVAKANNYPLDKLDPMKLVDTSFVTR